MNISIAGADGGMDFAQIMIFGTGAQQFHVIYTI
jgi:hypothetical protein